MKAKSVSAVIGNITNILSMAGESQATAEGVNDAAQKDIERAETILKDVRWTFIVFIYLLKEDFQWRKLWMFILGIWLPGLTPDQDRSQTRSWSGEKKRLEPTKSFPEPLNSQGLIVNSPL